MLSVVRVIYTEIQSFLFDDRSIWLLKLAFSPLLLLNCLFVFSLWPILRPFAEILDESRVIFYVLVENTDELIGEIVFINFCLYIMPAPTLMLSMLAYQFYRQHEYY